MKQCLEETWSRDKELRQREKEASRMKELVTELEVQVWLREQDSSQAAEQKRQSLEEAKRRSEEARRQLAEEI